MIIEVLKEMADMPVFSKKNLANKFHTNDTVIEQVLKELQRMGCISKEENNNGCNLGCGSCKGCPMASSNGINGFTVTEKGKRIIKNTNLC